MGKVIEIIVFIVFKPKSSFQVISISSKVATGLHFCGEFIFIIKDSWR
jgi:hypothetical protein